MRQGEERGGRGRRRLSRTGRIILTSPKLRLNRKKKKKGSYFLWSSITGHIVETELITNIWECSHINKSISDGSQRGTEEPRGNRNRPRKSFPPTAPDSAGVTDRVSAGGLLLPGDEGGGVGGASQSNIIQVIYFLKYILKMCILLLRLKKLP